MKPVYFVYILFCLFVITNNCRAQVQYPKSVLPGQKLEVASGKDTLWILNNTQFDNALIHAKELKICDSAAVVQKQVIANRESVIATQKEKINILDTAYQHYKNLWSACDSSLQKKEIEVVNVKKSKKIIAIASTIAGALIATLLIAIF
jgi:hypothetical protein